MKRFIYENSLSLAMFSLFFVFLIGLSVTGNQHQNEQLTEHNQTPVSYGAYVASGDFVEAVFENWESEFLQMWALVVLTIFLVQKGSPDSKAPRPVQKNVPGSRHVLIRNLVAKRRHVPSRRILYENSLGLALLTLFIFSFTMHAVGGAQAYNEEARAHHEPTASTLQYVSSSKFWFESFQNWQSEFLSVGILMVFSVFLRQKGSPESKPVDATNELTGE